MLLLIAVSVLLFVAVTRLGVIVAMWSLIEIIFVPWIILSSVYAIGSGGSRIWNWGGGDYVYIDGVDNNYTEKGVRQFPPLESATDWLLSSLVSHSHTSL